MSLNTSSGAYEQLYNPSAPENEDKYYDGYVEMKESFRKWTRHWCVLKKKNLHFFKDVNTQICDNYLGYFPLEVPTHIEKKGTKEWSMKTSSRKITLRVHVDTLRDSWIKAFEQTLRGEKPTTESYILEGSGPARMSPPVSPLHNQSSQFSNSRSTHTPSPGPSPSRRVSSGSVRYMMTEEQVRNMAEHAINIAEKVEVSAAEIRIQEELLKDNGWYQASLRREDVEEILKHEKNGVFIVRDYIDTRTSCNMGYVISLKDQNGGMRHHKIQRIRDKLQIKGYEEKVFDTLHKLLCFFIPSQRKKINLVPYNPSASQADSVDGDLYEKMDSPTSNGTSATPTRSRSVHDSRPVPPAPTAGMVRAETFEQRPLPDTPNGQSITENYVDMKSPMTNRNLPPLPIAETPMSPPLSPDNGYINIPPPPSSSCLPSYENIEQSPYINTQSGGIMDEEEGAPALPPKRRSASVDEGGHPYVNLPPQGPERPPKPPLRKAHTFGR